MNISAKTAILLTAAAFLPEMAGAEPLTATAGSVFLEGCGLSIMLEDSMAPLEVQADSILGIYRDDHSFFALVCRPNPRRTFEPMMADGIVSERPMQVLANRSPTTKQFHTELFEKRDVPLKGLHSWNLRFASRDHVFRLTVYPDPARQKTSSRRPPDGPEIQQARLERLAASLLLEEGTEPAILESTYRQRLWAAGLALMTILFAGGLAVLILVRKRALKNKSRGQ